MLKNLSFRRKLLISLCTIVSVTIVGSSTIYIHSRQVKQEVHYVSNQLMELNMLTAEMQFIIVNVQRLISNGSLTQDEDMLMLASTESRKFHKYAASIKTILTDQTLKDRIQEIIRDYELLFAEAVLMSSLYVAERVDDGEEKLEMVIKLSDKLNNKIKHFESRGNEVMIYHIKTIEKRLDVITKIVFALVLISIGVTIAVSLRIRADLVRPIENLKESIQHTANGDLTVIFPTDRTDEIGTISSSMSDLVMKFNQIISEVVRATNQVATSAGLMSASSQQVAVAAEDQSVKTGQAANAMEEMNRMFIEVAQNTSEAAEASKLATDFASAGLDVVQETIRGMQTVSDSVNASATIIQTLGQGSEQIGEIIKVIDDIAGQTNLLALNAAIEAARAGEQGRGFAVVADEVRKLAERTTSATREIGDMIKSIQRDTKSAVTTMKTGTSQVNNGVILASEAGNALQKIVDAIETATDLIGRIAAAAEEQSVAGNEVTNNIESVAAITSETAKSVKATAESSKYLNTISQELQGLVSEFTIDRNDSTGTIIQADADASISDSSSTTGF